MDISDADRGSWRRDLCGYARAVAATDVQALLAELEEWAAGQGAVAQTHRYGPGPEHEADLLLPAGAGR